KAGCAVHSGVRPPTVQLREPNPSWEPEHSPFCFDLAARPWIGAGRRVAGVSAFGFGGTNFHAVLSSYDKAPQPRHGLDTWPTELFLFTGTNHTTAITDMDRLAELITTNNAAGRPWRLRDLARSVSTPRRDRVWAAIVAEDLDDLTTKLAHAKAGIADDGVFLATDASTLGGGNAGQVAFLFPGQGSQRPGMLAELFIAFPRLQRHLDTRWSGIMFPPAAFATEDSARQLAALTDTRIAQPALGIIGLAMHDLLTGLGIHPDHLAGHSYGELVALAASGAVAPEQLLE